MNNEKKKMSKSLKITLVTIGVLLIVAIAVVLVVFGVSKKNDGNDLPGTVTTPKENFSLPADTEVMLETYEELDTVSVTLNQIDFAFKCRCFYW